MTGGIHGSGLQIDGACNMLSQRAMAGVLNAVIGVGGGSVLSSKVLHMVAMLTEH